MYRKCPRCKEKCLTHEKSCHECGLIFERLNYTSNKSAKKLILKGNRRDTIQTSDWPYDAKKSTALLLCGFLGITGAHNFYLGRFFKGAISLFGFVLSLIMVILTDVLYGSTVWTYLYLLVIIPGSCVLIFWVSDFFAIFFEKYKIPVAIDENLIKLKETIIENKSEKELKNKKEKKNKEKTRKNKEKNKKTEIKNAENINNSENNNFNLENNSENNSQGE